MPKIGEKKTGGSLEFKKGETNAFFISAAILPVMIMLMLVCGMVKKVRVYDTFVDGAKEGLKVAADIMPTLIGLMVAVGVLQGIRIFCLRGTFLSRF